MEGINHRQILSEEIIFECISSRVYGAIVFSAMLAGQISAFGPDAGKAKLAAGRLMDAMDREPLIDSSSPDGEKPVSLLKHIVNPKTK